MTLAAIDVGTNTVLLLVAEVDAEGRVTTLADEVETPRLGRDVDQSGRIRAEGIRELGALSRSASKRTTAAP